MTDYQRTVTTQAELNKALADKVRVIDIRSPAGVWMELHDTGSATVSARDSATVSASGSATVSAWGSATVRASGSATVSAWDSATVSAWDSATVSASGSATVRAWDSATVSASGSATVYERDEFSYQPGTDSVPRHVIDWDAEDRGPLRLVYAYARMKDGATSKVIVLNRAAIKTIKASAKGAETAYSPWQTNEASMWLKSAVRQLQKWVPTSSEIRGMPASATLDLASASSNQPAVPLADYVENVDTGEVIEGEWIDESQGATA